MLTFPSTAATDNCEQTKPQMVSAGLLGGCCTEIKEFIRQLYAGVRRHDSQVMARSDRRGVLSFIPTSAQFGFTVQTRFFFFFFNVVDITRHGPELTCMRRRTITKTSNTSTLLYRGKHLGH